ncbi:MAG: hypothetical protein ACR2PE_03580 [Porticoccus sp.]
MEKKEKLANQLVAFIEGRMKKDIAEQYVKVEKFTTDAGHILVRSVEIGKRVHPTDSDRFNFDFDESAMKSTVTEKSTGKIADPKELNQWFSEQVVIPKEEIKRWDVTTWFCVGHHEEESDHPFISIEGTASDSLLNEYESAGFTADFDKLIDRLNYEPECSVLFQCYG